MSPNIRRNIGTHRDDAKTMRAGKFQCSARELGRQTLAFQRRGHFCMIEDDFAREAAIRNQCAIAVDRGLKAMRLFIVHDGHAAEIRFHASPHLKHWLLRFSLSRPAARTSEPRIRAAHC